MYYARLNEVTTIKQGDTEREFTATFTDSTNTPVDLTNAVVTLFIANPILDAVVIEKQITITDAPNGAVLFGFDENDVTGYGELKAEFLVQFPNASQATVPTNGYVLIKINRRLQDLGNETITPDLYTQIQTIVNGQDAKIQDIYENGIDPVAKQQIEDAEANITALQATQQQQYDEITTDIAEDRQRARINAQTPLYIETYYTGDNHSVHPSVLYFSDSKYGFKYVMAFTPYSEMRNRFENPSIVVSDDGTTWRVPKGLTNPLVTTPLPDTHHYSDVELLDNGTQLELWYRYTDKPNQISSIHRQTTTDCINWTSQETVFPMNSTDKHYISPSLLLEGGTYKLYYRSDSGNYVRVTSTDRTNWTSEVAVNFDFGEYSDENWLPWHLEIRYFPSESKYIALVCANNDNMEYKLFRLDSLDAMNFSNAKLMIEPSRTGFDSHMIYRASLIKVGVWWNLYYSAFAKDNSCHIGFARGATLDTLVGFKAIEQEYINKQILKTDTLSHRPVYKDRNGIKGEIRRVVHFILLANGGNGTIIDYGGYNDFVSSVTSTANGFSVNLKNIPSTSVPSSIVVDISSDGMVTAAANINWRYRRTATSSTVEYGLKYDKGGPHVPFNQVTNGAVEITLFI